jgi:aspartate aminotransferase
VKELKNAIINKLKRENNLEYNINQICVSSGAKQVIYNAFMASLNPGDEVIILTPYWVSYPEMVKIAGGIPIIVKGDAKNNFCLNIEEIEKAITPKTKWLMINSPNNPSGIIYSYEELKALANMLAKHQHVHILSDDIYEHFNYDNNNFYALAQIAPELKNRILTVNGVSKTYAMTGWRIGYAAGPIELINAMGIVQSQSTSGACSISQMAAVEALNGPQDFVEKNRDIFSKRRNLVVNSLNQIPGIKCATPKGAFYVFPDCSNLLGKKTPEGKTLHDSNDLATYLLEQGHVAAVSGDAFGADGFLRISYSTKEENLKEGCDRISKACQLLKD